MIDTICLVDTETTGTDPVEGAALLEVAMIRLIKGGDGTWSIFTTDQTFVEYEGDIPPEARAVHHISPAMVRPGAEGVIKYSEVLESMKDLETENTVYSAHNAEFDKKFLPEFTNRPWICTYRCALHILPDSPSYKNQVLRYYLGLEPDQKLLEGLAPHRALYDTAVTAELLLHMLNLHSAEELVTMTNTPVLLKTCMFGKHRGQAWEEVPRSYLNWMLREGVQSDNVDVQHTIRHHLGLL